MTDNRSCPPASAGGLYALKEQMAVSGICSALNRVYLVGVHRMAKDVRVMRPDCGRWSCPECAEANKNMWRHRIAAGVQVYVDDGEEWSFGTLTANRFRRGFGKTLYDWRRYWPVLYRRIKRYVAPETLHFVMLPELHTDRSMHMHVLWSASFPGRRVVRKKDGSVYYRSKWLADNCAAVGLGYIHDNRPLGSALEAAHYVTKYVTKSLGVDGWPRHLHRVRTSHGWPVQARPKKSGDYDWSVYPHWQDALLELDHLLTEGYTIAGLRA